MLKDKENSPEIGNGDEEKIQNAVPDWMRVLLGRP
jgi:hypothetical protein